MAYVWRLNCLLSVWWLFFRVVPLWELQDPHAETREKFSAQCLLSFHPSCNRGKVQWPNERGTFFLTRKGQWEHKSLVSVQCHLFFHPCCDKGQRPNNRELLLCDTKKATDNEKSFDLQIKFSFHFCLIKIAWQWSQCVSLSWIFFLKAEDISGLFEDFHCVYSKDARIFCSPAQRARGIDLRSLPRE